MADRETQIQSASDLGVFATIRRGVQVTPEIVQGIGWTLLFAVLAAAGKITVPLAVQQAVDTAVDPAGINLERILLVCLVALGAVLASGLCTAFMNVRLIKAAETGLARLRERAFSHIHQLTVLTQNSERKGSLVSRVTSDVDTISMFVQWGGIMLLTSILQLVAATVVMFWFSWQLTLLVWVTFIPFVILLQPAQRAVNRGFTAVRAKMGALLGAVSESVVGASTVTAYGIGPRTEAKINTAVEEHRVSGIDAMKKVAISFSAGVFAANLVLVVVVIGGAYLGVAGEITPGQLVAFLFLVQLFTGPVQLATEVLNEMQNAVAGWRRVLAILETEIDVPFKDASTTTIPKVLDSVDLNIAPGQRVAVVGETGSGKTTLAKLITRFVDPVQGRVLLDGIDLRDHSEHDLRRRVLLVPQEGFLFATSLRANISYPLIASGEYSEVEIATRVEGAVSALGLDPWLANFPAGLDSEVGQRGERLSAGERQLVALARAYVCEADLLVMDEVTSAVDPATEVAISRALDALMENKSTVTIAHRLSTAQNSDVVVVMDRGRVVELGSHDDLIAREGRYAAMFSAWLAQTNSQV
jgi:ABC-type multidrug transport system fused ATPase/permease subunit